MTKLNPLYELVRDRIENELPTERLSRIIRYANFELRYKINELTDAEKESIGEIGYLKWFERIVRRGRKPGHYSKKLIADLNEAMLPIWHVTHPALNPKTYKMAYQSTLHSKDHDVQALVAYDIVGLIDNGSLKRLKRCGYSKCRKFFLARADAVVCCNSHGVLKKRAENK